MLNASFTSSTAHSSVKHYIFNSGSVIDWALSEPELVKEFKKEGCYELIKTADNMAIDPDPNLKF